MAQNTNPGAAGGAPTADQPGSIRNVVLVGHSGSGKTTLVEALLTATGTINRAGRVEDGTTVTDFDEAEHRQQRSVSLALAPLEHAGVKVNLLDTPGYADFVGDLRAGPARGGRRPVRRLGRRRPGRRDAHALGGVRRRLDAAGGRHHQARQGPRRLRRGRGDLPARLRRRGAPPLPADGRRRRQPGGRDRPALTTDLRLLERQPRRARPRRRAPAADRVGPQLADRGDHRRVRGRGA